MMTFAHRFIAYSVLALATLLGGVGLLAFMLFVYVGPLQLVELGLDESTCLLFDACLCLIFFVQHSVMIRASVRERLAHIIPVQYDAAFFGIVSGVILIIMVVFWQQSAYTIAAAQDLARWLVRGVFLFRSPFLLGGGEL